MVSDIPEAPPPELASSFAVAEAAHQRLEAAGLRLHFETDIPGRRLTVEVLALDGALRATISGSDALRLAGGWSVPAIADEQPRSAQT
jgi:hypothetical protein